jgi:hypothetical protein
MQFINGDQVISAVLQVLEEISFEMLGRLMDDWVDLLRECVEVGRRVPYLTEKRNLNCFIFARFALTALTFGPPHIREPSECAFPYL